MAAAQRPLVEEHRPRWREVADAVLANRLALAALVVLGLLLVLALIGQWVAPYGVNDVIIADRLQPPSLDHPFGTDELGRDLFSRVILAVRVSLYVGLVAVGISLVAGVAIGLLAGYYGRWADTLLMRLMDMVFAFPAILLAIAILAVLGPGITNAMIAIGIVYTPIFARVTRGSVLSVREEVYVRAARSLGASDARLILRHVLPNVSGPIIVQASLSLAFAILSEAALSFLGLGVQPPDPSWGRMLLDGRGFLDQAWWMGLFPGVAILVTVMAFNFLGDGLRDALDPKQLSVIESRGHQA
ncbi:MAG: ABC transporter permease [Actinobacteria bacterium]|nr:ABC transporter permease [Actinomycetota bacterium]MBW3643475.1 ABC transporter permease [Actinomycetota bacterium]